MFVDEMETGRAAIAARDFAEAYRAFGRAHDVGHAVKRDHLAAHRGMIRAAVSGRRYDRVAKNAVLLGAAFLFDRDKSAVGTT